MSLDKIESIKRISKSLQTEATTQGVGPAAIEPNRERFKALMQTETRTTKAVEAGAPGVQKPSVMEEAGKVGGKVDPTQKASVQEIVAQTDTVTKRIESLKEKLKTSQLDLKPSVQTLLRKRLQHIDESIQAALSKTGVESKEAPVEKGEGLVNPIQRFLGLLAHGQNELDHLAAAVSSVGASSELSPAAMLAIQIKVGRVQQELELFTSLLNKALESTKTIMNVQV